MKQRLRTKSSPSLRAWLTSVLLMAVLVIACIQAAMTWRTARAETEAVFDAQIERMALSLTGGLASAFLGDDVSGAGAEDLIIQIWRIDGLMLYRSPSARLLPQQAVLGFSNVRAGGTTYRVFAVRTPLQVVQVAQDFASRRQMAGRLALRAALPALALAPILMLLVWWVIGRALAPVERVRRQVAARRADDLAPLSTEGVPAEMLPLVVEMNGLLARLAAAWDALQNFTADAAHELRSPLAALRLQLQSLRRAELPESREVATRRLISGVDRATRLIEQLLALARQEGGGDTAQPEIVNLTALVQAAVRECADEARARGIVVTMLPLPGEGDLGQAPGPERPSDAISITGFPDALSVLLRNLLENALHYTPEGGHVNVRVERASAGAHGELGVRLIVEDSGPGIEPQQRQRVLDRFYRVAGASGHGSGLGLAIVKAVADRHGARIFLDESPDWGGLKVTVEFALSLA